MFIPIWIVWTFVIGLFIFREWQHARVREWRYEREVTLLDEIEGPYWARDGYRGETPANKEKIMEGHNQAIRVIMGDERLAKARRRNGQQRIS